MIDVLMDDYQESISGLTYYLYFISDWTQQINRKLVELDQIDNDWQTSLALSYMRLQTDDSGLLKIIVKKSDTSLTSNVLQKIDIGSKLRKITRIKMRD